MGATGCECFARGTYCCLSRVPLLGCRMSGRFAVMAPLCSTSGMHVCVFLSLYPFVFFPSVGLTVSLFFFLSVVCPFCLRLSCLFFPSFLLSWFPCCLSGWLSVLLSVFFMLFIMSVMLCVAFVRALCFSAMCFVFHVL